MAKLSTTELCLMRSIWHSGAQSAREIHDATQQETGWSYSSTRKTLDRMVEKGVVQVRLVHGIKVFEASEKKLHTIAALIQDFTRNVLESDTSLPAAAFAGSKLISEDEIDELDKLLKDLEAKS